MLFQGSDLCCSSRDTKDNIPTFSSRTGFSHISQSNKYSKRTWVHDKQYESYCVLGKSVRLSDPVCLLSSKLPKPCFFVTYDFFKSMEPTRFIHLHIAREASFVVLNCAWIFHLKLSLTGTGCEVFFFFLVYEI